MPLPLPFLRSPARPLPGQPAARALRAGLWRAVVLVSFIVLLLAGARAEAQLPARSAVATPHVTAELLAHAPQGVEPGATIWLGLRIRHQPGWHTYWKNAGDSGLPTELQWTLPAGLAAGDIQWPLPRKFPIGPLANYGYEDTVLLPVAVSVGADFQPPQAGTLDIGLQASWLVCKVECIPEQGQFALTLPAQGSTALHGAAFEAALASQPQDLPRGAARRLAVIDGGAPAGALQIVLGGFPDAVVGQPLAFFTETPETIETGAPWQQEWVGGEWHAQVPLSTYRSASPAVMPVLVTYEDAQGRLHGWRAELPVAGGWPPLPQPLPLSAAGDAGPARGIDTPPPAATPVAPAPLAAYWLALAGALLGGMLLNLMPCVFPVLAIKAMGLTGQDRATLRLTGLAYTAGVVASFVALAALMLALRAGGQSLGWGFQLQSPWVVAGLAALFTMLGLNLAGVFQFGAMAPAGLAARQLRHPVPNALLSGVLAVAVASPCTAPFMGASLGFTLTLPASQTLLLFAVMGLGLALPFLAISLLPQAARLLPRPGAWMETLRQLMAFPMFATVAWLAWVLGQQSGIDGVAALLAVLVALALLLWSLGRTGTGRWALRGVAAAVLLALGATLGPQIGRETPVAAATAGTPQPADGWQAWSPEREAALLAQGRPVFVDYTAAWCITCQYNKRTTLSDPAALDDFKAAGVVLLRADWTRRDAAITASLAALGRNGVPVYVLRRPGQPPVLLPEILSTRAIRDALSAS